MSEYDLSIILPGIRVSKWEQLFFSIERSIGSYSFEFIAVGPYEPSKNLLQNENFKFIQDFGCPSRCVQIGSSKANGKYLCWMSDDGLYEENTLMECIDLLEQKNNKKDAVALRYFEGEGRGEFPIEYWTARHHADQQIAGVKEGYKIAPLGMYNTDYFREIGGLDCRYEHINMCCHDLAFRLQNDGGIIHFSPSTVARFYWSWIGPDAGPVQAAYHQNDGPLFNQEWSQDQSKRIKIDFDNWRQSPKRWIRRFG